MSGGLREFGWGCTPWREASTVMLKLKVQRKTDGEGGAWLTRPPKRGERDARTMGDCWRELPSLVCIEKMLLCPVCSLPPCLMVKEACAISSPQLLQGMGSLGVFFLAWWLTSFAVQKGPPWTVWAALRSQPDAILHMGLWPEGGREGVSRFLRQEGAGGRVTRQACPWASLLFKTKKWGEGSCKHNGCAPCVCTVETRLEESCELIVC